MHTVLIIEKNHFFLEILLELLKRKGLHTIGTCNSRLGLQLIKEQMPDLIICDLSRPDLRGYQVLKTLRQDSTTKNIPLIAFSTNLTEGERYYALKLGADACLEKSCPFEELFKVIKTNLEKITLDKSAQLKKDKFKDNLILMIEDDKNMRTSISKILEPNKFNLISAEDSFIGLKLAKKLKPNLIICDINMPNINGYEILKNIRHDWITAKTPFIFLTCETATVSRRYAWQLGANDYLTKPVDSRKLLNSISNQFKLIHSTQ